MRSDRLRVAVRRFGTVRWRLTLLATAVVAVVLVASAVALVLVQRHLLTEGIDETLVQRADNIEERVVSGAFDRTLPAEGDPEDSFLQLLDDVGGVRAASVNVVTLPAVVPPLPPQREASVDTVSGVPLSGHDFRVLRRGLDTRDGPATLVVAKNLDDVAESVGILRASLALAIPVVVSVLAVLVWWLTGRVLRPVESIRAEVAGIQGTDLYRRVPVPGSYDEISRLARTMNEMLARVEQAGEGQRQFVADASHELRSPLTRLRAELEVALAHPDSTDPAQSYESLLADTVHLQQLADDLLFLARLEAGPPAAPTGVVDLDDLVLAEARRLRENGRVRLDTTAVGAARVVGDRGQLARAVRNLAGNAERHAATTVTFALRERDGLSELVVSDDGPGVPPEHRATVFQRFARLDEARSRDEGGSGLGLAIVSDIVTRHGGTVAITSCDGEGARFVVRLPRAG